MANNNMILNNTGLPVSRSKAAGCIIVIGSDGLLIAEECLPLGYPNFPLVRDSPASDDEKPKLILHGSLEDQASLEDAIKKEYVVMSAVKGPQPIKAIEKFGTIKSLEFGNYVDNIRAMEPEKIMFGPKAEILTATKGFSYLYVYSNCFAEASLASLGQPGLTAPPDDQAGNDKVAFLEVNVTFTSKEVDDPRALNSMPYNLRFPVYTYSINEALWEMKIGNTLENTYVPEEEEQNELVALWEMKIGNTLENTYVPEEEEQNELVALWEMKIGNTLENTYVPEEEEQNELVALWEMKIGNTLTQYV